MSGDGTALGDAMKELEAVTRQTLPPRGLMVVRADGRAFHTYLRGAKRPYDAGFMAAMDETAAALCAEIGGAVFAYTQSDEISVLAATLEGQEPWFGGVAQKIASVAASAATAALWQARHTGRPPLFDARAFPLPEEEAVRYFAWRQRDCERNSVAMAAQAVFHHKRLQGLGSMEMREMLASAGSPWEDLPAGFRRGRVCVRVPREEPVSYVHKRTGETMTATAVRHRWESDPAPLLAHADWIRKALRAHAERRGA